MNYLLNLSYDGSKFFGSAKQKDKKTVQGEVERVLCKRFNMEIKTNLSGRTDRFVHSIDSYLNFKAPETNIDLLMSFLNKSFNGEIYIKSIEKVSDIFHARYNVANKTYLYIINTGEFNPIEKDYKFQYCKEVSISKFEEVGNYLIGIHNFKKFTPSSNKQNSYERAITDIVVKRDDDLVYLYITGTGFLQYMVRNIVSLMLKYNEDKVSADEIKNLFSNDNENNYNNPINPEGLYLYKTTYN